MAGNTNLRGPRQILGLFLAALVLGVGGLLYWKTETSIPQPAPAVVAPTRSAAFPQSTPRPLPAYAAGRIQVAPPDPATLANVPPSPLARALGARATPPGQEPGIVMELLVFYRRQFGAFPAGEDNRQIVNALLGANPQKLPILPSDHPRLSSGGELLDAWDQPFFFHQISRDEVQVRSAGPDRQLFTDDDSVSSRGKNPE